MKSYSVFTGMRDIEIQLEDKNFLYYAEHEDYTPELSQDQLICQALDHPFSADRLDQIPADTKVIIIIDDATRPTPTSAILPYIWNVWRSVPAISLLSQHRVLIVL